MWGIRVSLVFTYQTLERKELELTEDACKLFFILVFVSLPLTDYFYSEKHDKIAER